MLNENLSVLELSNYIVDMMVHHVILFHVVLLMYSIHRSPCTFTLPKGLRVKKFLVGSGRS